jgi:hypothetical protein
MRFSKIGRILKKLQQLIFVIIQRSPMQKFFFFCAVRHLQRNIIFASEPARVDPSREGLEP